ncbi:MULTISPECIES: ATP-binding protein [Catenuloplanes]|uniref:Sensor-like histidine kinase SenX3 n=1 Tax=Catenuloplanes niger TaxID=587534 RepID=A0AAE3ZL31_9ACTN|nr:ATP-binding protein [Catenuloplanes niger]MDR7320661.1 signal transduction histidine kinase/CHASE3 domain sensor protein [Catenuloplanes niger]
MTSLRRRFAWLVTTLVLVGIMQLAGGQILVSRFESSTTRIDVAQTAHQVMLQSMINAETGIRGYQLTANRDFLQPYTAGVARYPEALRTAAAYTGDAAARQRLAEEDAAAQRWITQFAAPAAAAPPDTSGPRPGVSTHGKTLFDAYRQAHTRTEDVFTARRQAAAHQLRTTNSILQGGLAVLALLAVVLALRLSERTRRLLLSPLSALQDVLGRLADGDRSARAPVVGPPEVKLLAQTLNACLDETARAEAGLRTAHDTLLRQEAYVRQVLDVIDVAVMTCDADGAIVSVNQRARRLARQPIPAHIRDLTHVVHTGNDVQPEDHPLARALTGQTVAGLEMTFEEPDGSHKAVMVDARPMRDDAGHLIGAVVTGYDVSTLRAREAELTAFAGIVAHDLRAPLAAVAGFADVLTHDLDAGTEIDPDVLRPTVARIESGTRRMGQLIDDLLAYATARDAPIRPVPVDLQPMVDDIVSERTAHLHAARPSETSPPLPSITTGALPVLRADAPMIRQVLDNLIGNALKYTRAQQPAEISITTEKSTDEWATICVADRGIGIPAEQRHSVFTSFHRAHPEQPYTGTGLGLAICWRIVDRHGGSIAIDDNPGGGTRIHLTLPAAEPLATTAHADGT